MQTIGFSTYYFQIPLSDNMTTKDSSQRKAEYMNK